MSEREIDELRRAFVDGSDIYHSKRYDKAKFRLEVRLEDEQTAKLLDGTIGNPRQVALILYTLAHLRCADCKTLLTTLKTRQTKHKDLTIGYFSDSEAILESRLRMMVNYGLVSKKTFIQTIEGEGNDYYHSVYIPTNSGIQNASWLLNGRRLLADAKIIECTEDKILSYANTAFVLSELYQCSNALSMRAGVAQYKETGTIKYPGEIVFKIADNSKCHVAIQTLYIHKQEQIETKTEYLEGLVQKLNSIICYVKYGPKDKRKNDTTAVVVVCEDLQDLTKISRQLTSVPENEELIKNVYFTCERAIKKFGIKKAFVNIAPANEEEVQLIPAKLPFIN